MNEPQDTLTEQPMGFGQRVKAALGVVTTGKLPNPLASAPKDRSRAALVKELNDWCVTERKFWKPVFDRMRQEQRFAAGKQWEGSIKDTQPEQEEYTGDILQQTINRKVAALYSKNPTPEFVIKERMNYTVWDGQQQTIDSAKAMLANLAPQAMQMHEAELSGQDVPPPPEQMSADIQQAQAILQDYNQGMAEKAMIEKVGRTGELLIQQQFDEQSPDMLICAKQAVAQVEVSRVAYAKVMFKRDMSVKAVETANQDGLDSKIGVLEARLRQLEQDIEGEDDARSYEAKVLHDSISKELAEMQFQEAVDDEGIVIDWLSATSVIIDRRCKCLREFLGARRIAHEIMMSVSECEARYNVNLRDSGAKFYVASGDGWKTEQTDDFKPDDNEISDRYSKKKVCVFEIQDKEDGLVYTICDGVKDFIEEPHENEPEVNRFWSIVPLNFNCQVVEENDPENDCTIFSRSTVRLGIPMQLNINWAGEEKKKHRNANRPAWLTFGDVWASTGGNSDLERISAPRNAHDVFKLQSVNSDKDAGKLLVPFPKQPFDPNLYDNAQDMQAFMLATGLQAADLGEQRSDEKATGQQIAAQARATVEASNIGDLDFFWGTIVQMMWEMLIAPDGMSEETVKRKVGRGAVWPKINNEQIADAIWFKIEAGSMGRPNQAANLQKIQVLMPQLIQLFQVMGKNPEPLAKMVLREYDANIDLDELMKDAQIPPPPAPEQQKAPSVSISASLKDLPPEEQNQAVKKFYGLDPASPASTLLNKVGHDKAIAAHHQNANPQPPEQNKP